MKQTEPIYYWDSAIAESQRWSLESARDLKAGSRWENFIQKKELSSVMLWMKGIFTKKLEKG